MHKVTPRSVEQAIEAIRSEQSRRNSNNEMILLQLQQVMHQRSQCVEVTSQLLRNLQRTQDAIVQNLGR